MSRTRRAATAQLYATSDPSGSLSSQTNGDPQTAQEPLVTSVASGQCTLNLRYNDISGASAILAQQTYTFPSPAATFSAPSTASQAASSVLASTSATLTEPICPSDGECSWFGFVIAEPATTGCPQSLTPGVGPVALWVGAVLDSPGTESATVSQTWDTSAGALLFCGYIDGPGVSGEAGLVGQATYTPPPAPTQPSPTPTTTQPTPTLTPKPKVTYTMTLSNLHQWVFSAVADHFFGGGASAASHARIRVSACSRLTAVRFRCNVSWRAGQYAFAGTVTVGNANATTGRFRFGFDVIRTDTRTMRRRRIIVPY